MRNWQKRRRIEKTICVHTRFAGNKVSELKTTEWVKEQQESLYRFSHFYCLILILYLVCVLFFVRLDFLELFKWKRQESETLDSWLERKKWWWWWWQHDFYDNERDMFRLKCRDSEQEWRIYNESEWAKRHKKRHKKKERLTTTVQHDKKSEKCRQGIVDERRMECNHSTKLAMTTRTDDSSFPGLRWQSHFDMSCQGCRRSLYSCVGHFASMPLEDFCRQEM